MFVYFTRSMRVLHRQDWTSLTLRPFVFNSPTSADQSVLSFVPAFQISPKFRRPLVKILDSTFTKAAWDSACGKISRVWFRYSGECRKKHTKAAVNRTVAHNNIFLELALNIQALVKYDLRLNVLQINDWRMSTMRSRVTSTVQYVT